jgi:hypothetical protein
MALKYPQIGIMQDDKAAQAALKLLDVFVGERLARIQICLARGPVGTATAILGCRSTPSE